MNNILRKSFCNWKVIIFILFQLRGIYSFLISDFYLEQWLIVTNYIPLYLMTSYFLITLSRIKLFLETSELTRIRLQDEGYSKYLVKSFWNSILIFFIVIYLPYIIIGAFTIKYPILLIIYFSIILTQQLLNEMIIFYVIYNRKSSLYIVITLFNQLFVKYFIFAILFP